MRKTLGVCLLILLLTAPAGAGEIPNDTPTPPKSRVIFQEPTETAQAPNTDGIIPDDTGDGLTQIALDLFAVLSSLL